jgi:L-threonylcarbamoyladenylate synthase
MSRMRMHHDAAIERAAETLRSGGLVAFPTETVYGLGADATNPQAVRKIFAAKGRPSTNPLIVHVHNTDAARRYVTHWPDSAQKLADAFWPGPLTLVLPKTDVIAPEVTAGLPSVGLRVPNHPLALALLRAFDGPVAAPSANRSNRISPTTADHVLSDLGDSVEIILDGGPCMRGIESTVLNLTTEIPTILRAGDVGQWQIENVIGPVQWGSLLVDGTPAPSPGLSSTHYAPNATAWRFEPDRPERAIEWLRRSSAAMLLSPDLLARLTPTLSAHHQKIVILMPPTAEAYAQKMYATLRELDRPGVSDIVIEFPPDTPEWTAVRDRLRRATRPL